MSAVKNILFIMCDQLRADYLSCMGHPRLETPNLDDLAARGTLFTRAYCQSPVCGGSRMCFYTGRYAFTHGATWNGVPLSVGERTLGDYLRPLGTRVAVLGKSHVAVDLAGMARLGVRADSPQGILARQGGFEPYERDDGVWGKSDSGHPDHAYNKYLRSQGYNSPNPWHDFANSAEGPNGEILSGWQMRNCHLPARVAEEHSETAYLTNRAMDFIAETGDAPWCLHLSYIKPHWPYMAPAPYHETYGGNDVPPANRHPKERDNMHPVFALYAQRWDSQTFADDRMRAHVIPAYMGLVKQIDDHIGRLVAFLERQGRMDDTMIVFTSDHGDFLGDHWLAEKEAFFEEGIRIPMIVYEPSGAADAARGRTDDRLVESIDLVPTFIEAVGGEVPTHILEGRSLLPLLHGGNPKDWRSYAICESENSFFQRYWELGIEPMDARSMMVRTKDWKYIHHEKFRPELYDLNNDPSEFEDLGESPEHAHVRVELRDMLFESLRRRKTRVTYSEKQIEARARNVMKDPGARPNPSGHW
jgi:arylsulfatase A-like enzyme